ncbi:protein CNGC15b-like [Rhododendron vialii]|uniref:protein CNGC15b-like n=1 Tax=Rhododendron vialii TaxID=182163 RepID=UPI0026603430|nr:protein CNGC15b-like [Rhododendron vialii]
MSLPNSSSIRTRYQSKPEIYPETQVDRGGDTIKFRCNGKSLSAKALSRVFSEDFGKLKKKKTIIDPRGQFIRRWSKVFFLACLVCLIVDPLFFFVPVVNPNEFCLDTEAGVLQIALTVLRSITDLFFVINIVVRSKTAYVGPSSRVFGRGELVIDPWKISSRYLRNGFWYDFLAALPFPQVMIWCILPNLKGSTTSGSGSSLRYLMLIPYFQRLTIAYPLSIQIAKATGIVVQKAWLGAAYNLMLYLLSSHVMGSVSYLLSIQREAACWRSTCDQSNTTCSYDYFDCMTIGDPTREAWIQASNMFNVCYAGTGGTYPYGIYAPGVVAGVTSSSFLQRYFYSLWFGLRSVSTQGQNLVTSIFIGENIYSTIIVILGLLNLSLLIGNMEGYLLSSNQRIEEWRVKKSDKEHWMHHRQLPQELRESVHRYDRYKWVATYGVDEETLLSDLPKGLRRQIKRHLCLNLVRRVPLLEEMDDRMLDSICERLQPRLWTEGMFVIREGDPLNEMLFIIRGHLDSHTTNGGQLGFYDSCRIVPGDFCGEELLTWALKKHRSDVLPSSTRTVKASSDAEAFGLGAEDLRFVASQFHMLHSKKLRHKFRFYSHQWRTWAACFIQAAWRRFKRRKEFRELGAVEGGSGSPGSSGSGRGEVFVARPGSGLAHFASMLISDIRSKRYGSESGVLSPLPKPEED